MCPGPSDRGFLFKSLILYRFYSLAQRLRHLLPTRPGFPETGEPPGSNLEKMSWVSSALLRPPSRACARSPTRWKTSPATSPTRRPPPSSAIDTSFLDLIPETGVNRAARRQRHHRIARDQHGAGRRADRVGRDLHGDQRQRLLRGAEARQLHRQPAGVRRRRPLHPPRRLSSSTRTATWSTAPAIISRAFRSIRRPAT